MEIGIEEKPGLCSICGKPIAAREDGQGDNVVANIEIHPPRFPALITNYKNRWICTECNLSIAINIAKNDALF